MALWKIIFNEHAQSASLGPCGKKINCVSKFSWMYHHQLHRVRYFRVPIFKIALNVIGFRAWLEFHWVIFTWHKLLSQNNIRVRNSLCVPWKHSIKIQLVTITVTSINILSRREALCPVKVITEHVRIRIYVRNLTCPVISFIGHKPPSYFEKGINIYLCVTHWLTQKRRKTLINILLCFQFSLVHLRWWN